MSEKADDQREKAKPPSKHRKGTGIGVGIALGVALGAAMDNVGAGIAIGLAIGIAFESRRRDKTP